MVGRLKIDRGIPSRLDRVPDVARAHEAAGYDGCWAGEINHDPFLPLTLAAEHTARIELGTSIAVAFARSPMTVAQLGWDLQDYSGGRFILGLGTQVRAHIENRFAMPWSAPVDRMAEYVAALRQIWSCWATGEKLAFEGEFYRHTLMTPMFTPEPSGQPAPRVYLAAVGGAMTALAGQSADGLIAHAFTTRRYLEEVTLPALARGLARSGRDRAELEVCAPVFIVTGRDDAERSAAAAAFRRQIAFYASTPAYRPVLDRHGWGELQPELRRRSLQGDWAAMAGLIDDEMLGTFAVVAEPDRVAEALAARCAGAIDRVLPGFAAGTPEPVIAAVLEQLKGAR